MAIYDYLCRANGRTVEVRHPMSESLSTWGELCARAGIQAGSTPDDAPVERVISAAVPLTGTRSADGAPGPAAGSCCGGSCGCAA